MTRVKLCGMTRPDDAAAAASLGADYIGVIFAGGPRTLTADRGREVLAAVRGPSKTVGVFGADDAETIAGIAHALELDVVQLHADPTADDVAAVRRRFGGVVWAAYRVEGNSLGAAAAELFEAADAVVLDARVHGSLGGTGKVLSWASLAGALDALPAPRAALVLAGGLRPTNVAEAMQLLRPDVVDVSSGVESAPGLKDHDAMRAFTDAARAAAAMPRSG